MAEAELTLGTSTKDNPYYMKIHGSDEYLTQVGVNIVTTSVESSRGSIPLDQPFEAYGEPDFPDKLVKKHGDGTSAVVNNPAGSLSVQVVDRYGNPIANQAVTFTVGPAVSNDPSVPLPAEYRNLEFYKREECSDRYPMYGDCPNYYDHVTVKTDYDRARAWVVLGNTVNTKYEVTASTPGAAPVTFTLYSRGSRKEPDRYADPGLYLGYIELADQSGNIVTAAKAGTALKAPLLTELYMYYEPYTLGDQYTCKINSEPRQCNRIIPKQVIEIKKITDGRVTYTPVEGGGSVSQTENLGAGEYQCWYTTGPQPGKNRIKVEGEAEITVPEIFYDPDIDAYAILSQPVTTHKVSLKSSQKVVFDKDTRTPSIVDTGEIAGYTVYGVDVELTVDPAFTVLNQDGYTASDTTLSYVIQPSDYRAGTAEIEFFEEGDSGRDHLVAYLTGDAVQGRGTAVIDAGSVFDRAKRYKAQVVLNYGTDVEIRGEKVPLTPCTFGFIDNIPDYALGGDETTPTDPTDDDSDNFFLRQDGDYKNIDIYYRILPDSLPVKDVKINIYPEMETTPIKTLTGPKTGDNLHVTWDAVDENQDFRDYGFYRAELVVTVDGFPEPLKTSIADADPALPGWQCPQDGLGIHDLVYKHRPEVYVGTGEVVAPEGSIYPFSPTIKGNYRLLKDNSPDGPAWSAEPNYDTFGDFPDPVNFDDPSYVYPVLAASMANDAGGVADHYIDIKDSNRNSTGGLPYLLHRGHAYGFSRNYKPNYVFIQYWMYETASHLPYNTTGLMSNVFWHEADWEMVQIAVRLKDSALPDNKADWILPWAATASQHYYGQTLAWRIDHPNAPTSVSGQRYVETAENDPNRIRIYIAENSHATYFRDGDINTPESSSTGVGTQVQYMPVFLAFDRISGAELLDDSDLLPLEKKNQTGIYDWPGKWGGDQLPGPLYRESKDEDGPSFRMDMNPVAFHNECRKLIGGTPDPETELK